LIPRQAQPSEVDLGELAGRRLRPTHGQPPPVEQPARFASPIAELEDGKDDREIRAVPDLG
jgi:hypothetical protein